MTGPQALGIRLRKGKPPFVPVPLGNGAFIRLRAATSAEIDAAGIDVGHQVAAIALGSEHAARAAELVPDFDLAVLADFAARGADERRALMRDLGFRGRTEVLQERLLLIALIGRCNDGWTGVHDAEGVPFDRPEPGPVADLLGDSTIAQRCRETIFARVHMEHAEGNALPASPPGGAGKAEKPAPPAAPAEIPAQKAPSAPMAAAVRK